MTPLVTADPKAVISLLHHLVMIEASEIKYLLISTSTKSPRIMCMYLMLILLERICFGGEAMMIVSRLSIKADSCMTSSTKKFDLNMENVIYMIDCNFIQEAPDKVYKLTNHASPFNFVQEAPDKVYTQYR